MHYENYRDTIAALVPFYDDGGGNATRIYTVSGEVMDDRRTMRWAIRKVARVFAADLEVLRKNYGNYLSLSQGVPLPFSDKLVLVPLKLRRVIGENDGAVGYVNVLAAEKVEDHPDPDKDKEKDNEKDNEKDKFKSIIHLTGNQAIPCFFTRKTAERRLRTGWFARERLLYSNNLQLDKSLSCGSGMVKENGGGEVSPELLIAMGKLLLKSLKP